MPDQKNCPSSLKLAPDPETPNFVLTPEQLAQLDSMPLPDSGNTLGFLHIAAKVDHELDPKTETGETPATTKNLATMGDAGRYIHSVLGKLKKVKGGK
jgi:hypothetical protein